jgi:hypothetical protein
MFRVIDDCPVLVAANREEAFARPGTPPEFWRGDPAFVAGRDPRAGGTWLGVNRHGVVAAVTNRPKSPPAAPRSRGLLCRDLLASRTAREAHERALYELDRHAYAGCNVLAIDASGAYLVHAGELLRSCPMPPGIHVVTARDLNDDSDRRIAHVCDRLSQIHDPSLAGFIESLPALLGDHGSPNRPAICLHAADRGTVSSSIIALPRSPLAPRWLHTQGPPCSTPFADYSSVLSSLGA